MPGYRESFLTVRVPLPVLTPQQRDDAAPMIGTSQIVVPYTNFSLVVSKSRRLAIYTSVNIDGKRLLPITRDDEDESFRLDKRIDRKHQIGASFYKGNDYDQGHLVRRLDPVWGRNALAAHRDTFFYTNCAPQHEKLNRDEWSDLEDYVLKNTDVHNLKINVFTGPVLGPNDPIEKGVAIPQEFWKVVTMINADGALSATAYLLSQRDLIRSRGFEFGAFRTYQVRLTEIERLTQLGFGALRAHDPLARTRDVFPARLIRRLADVVF